MIKKINIVMVVAFVALLGLKGLKDAKAARSRGGTVTANVPVETRQTPAIPPPHVYYARWMYFSSEDPISNRNGIMLDTIRAIFPDAKFTLLRGTTESFVEKLRTDPRAIVVGYGLHPTFKECLAAPTPICYGKYILMTLRSNPWRYTGPDSLDKLRIVMSEGSLDCRGLRERHERLGPDSSLLCVFPQTMTPMELAAMVEDGKADAFVAEGDRGLGGDIAIEATSVRMLQRFRKSPEVGRYDIMLYVSSLEKDYSDRVIEAYEAGIRRIDASGERRRIFDYYGMVPAPIKEK